MLLKRRNKMQPLPWCLVIFTLSHLSVSHLNEAAQLFKRQKPNQPAAADNVVAEMQVVCHSDAIELKMNTNTPFNGMVYAKDAPNSNKCVAEFNSLTNMTFRLPLKSCGTLFAEADDGIEYFNTVVVQPHMRLMTNQGKGYHIRCKYQTRERTIANSHFNVSASFQMQNNQQAVTTPLVATASMPSCTMKIFRSGRDDVAEAVKIGDKLIMVIEIDQQDMYGMRITNCVVRDGNNMAEQQLINDAGCPVDETIMPRFEYTNNSTRAAVSFPAHKFPHTSSVYYQCNVRLCINNGGCSQPDCSNAAAASGSGSGAASARKKRFVGGHGEPLLGQPLPAPGALQAARLPAAKRQDMSFDVYSGLYVSDIDIGESGSSDRNTRQVFQARDSAGESGQPEQNELCLTYAQTGLLLLLASLVTLAVVAMLVCQLGLVSSPSSGADLRAPGSFLSPHFAAASRRYYRASSATRDLYANQRHHNNQCLGSHEPELAGHC